MRVVSWFAGIGGFDLALRRAGHEIVGACEIDPFARRVYEARLGVPAWFPDGWVCLCGCEPYTTAACRCLDGPQYRALGNAVAVPVVEWLARRLPEEGTCAGS